ncbi:T9SS C-terminal target domain-containing protein [Pontibacter diazotrophicus]|uniref:endo-1,4-beta-xylanase n=1 Tax=Pontibacter diazotrophicus TaxID=1400979 RepID=A0A3D8LBB8_9BACT|nr:endo-1,4-beta-xylanase [Pontibacter diazotrophicus]RDV14698.1 T9SS C-terminal target domain-containing protein [Pontibacter diazotrophicus]
MKKVVLLILLFASLGSFTSRAQNLIPNGGFENDLANWWTQAASGTNASFTVVTEDKAEGSKALKVDVITPGANAWDVQAVNDAWASVTGKEYTLTFWAKAATSGSSFKMIQQVGDAYEEKTFTLTNTWQKYEWSFMAQAAELQLKFHFPNAGTFYIDGITIPQQEQVKNLISNGSFENGSGNSFTNWWTSAGNGSAAFTAATGSAQDGARALKVDVAALGSNPWEIQAVNDAWPSVTGKEYTLTFWAKAATAGSSFKTVLQLGGAYDEQTFTLTDTWQEYKWTFTAKADNMELKLQFLSTGTFYIDNIFIPSAVQAKELLTNGGFENGTGDSFTNWWTQVSGGGVGAFTAETSDVQSGSRAMKVSITQAGGAAYNIQAVNDAWPSVTGTEYTLTFYAKAATAGKNITVVQQTDTYASKNFELTDTWKQYEWTFTAQEEGLQLRLNFPEAGTFYIDNVSILGSVDDTPAPQPYTPTGPPIATGQPKFLGSVYSASQLPNFTAYFNQVVAENAGKWGSVEATRDVMNWTELDAAYELAKDNGFPFRMHVLIWGNQQPTWIKSLSPAEQLEEIEEWFAAVAERYPDIDFLEVVNEPTNDPPVQDPNDPGSGGYMEALGGSGTTGWDWVINSFKLARKYFPDTPLMLNDYSVENSLQNAQRYLNIINLLQAENLIDAIGIQGHAFSTRSVSVELLTQILDNYAATGLPIYITELDIDGRTDAVQLAEYQRIFPVFWEHPAVKGITLWGYRPGHWRTEQGAYLAYTNGAEREAFVWLQEYIQSNTNLHIPVVTVGQNFSLSEIATCNVVGTVAATDADANTTLQGWQITGGTGASVFAIEAATGAISIARPDLLDFTQTSYTLIVKVNDGFSTSAGETVTITIPKKIYVAHKGKTIHIAKEAVPAHLGHGDCIGKEEATVTLAGKSSVSNLKGIEAEALHVYPNPAAEGRFTVAVADFDITKKPVYQIVDAGGRKLVEQQMNSSTISNNLTLKPGIYFIRLISNNEVTVRKVIVQ